MKVLLCEDVRELGWLGDVVEVSTGYARNYLLPRGLAVVPTEGSLRSLAKEAVRRAEQRKLEREQMEKVASAVDGAEAVVAGKANEQGVLFGSIGPREIAENLRSQGFAIADEMVKLGEHIKQVGTHSVTIKFDKELKTRINVVVVAEGQEAAPSSEGAEESQESKPDDENG
jgi:large subunit ribosomal protein L9